LPDHDRAIRAFKQASEWTRLRAHWEGNPPPAAVAEGVTAEQWIGKVQNALICLGKCIAAQQEAPLASVLPAVRQSFFSRDPRFHRMFLRFSRRRMELAARFGEEADAMLVEEALRERLGRVEPRDWEHGDGHER
jgi:hypothetical protein